MEMFDIGTSLRAQLFGSRDDFESHPLFVKNPTLLSRLVSKLTYCVRDAPPRYIAVDLSRGVEDDSFEIAAYTDDHLVHLVYDPTIDQIVTSIVDRRSIKRIDLLSAPNFMGGDVPGTYEGSVNVQVFYEEITVHLPGDNQVTEQNRAALDVFLLSLMRDQART
jgi:hypothetical protein